jgi:hypothetical protein
LPSHFVSGSPASSPRREGPPLKGRGRSVSHAPSPPPLDENGDRGHHDERGLGLHHLERERPATIDNQPDEPHCRHDGVPVKWQLPDGNGGYIGDLGTVTSIRFQEAACQGFGALENALPVDASASGASGLRYDPAARQFIYDWKTIKSMAGKCYVLALGLNDGSAYTANFSVK